MYRRKGDLKVGTYATRENRFVVIVSYKGNQLRCHLPNPGRMEFLLDEMKTQLIFIPARAGSRRKTEATVIGILQGNKVINLDTLMFNPLLKSAINSSMPLFRSWKIISQETTFGKHRYDFVIEIDNVLTVVEVKSTTRVVDGKACFPDAVSKRASEHIRGLVDLAAEGEKVMVIFLIYQDAEMFRPCHAIDPEFAELFSQTEEIIQYKAYHVSGYFNSRREIEYEIVSELPIDSATE